ncbi:MAG: polyisoprenoid-binding protein [Nitrospirota bacterium]|nr:polyisoprenoid-binding protein [Nitrospirota bacterium]MDE3117483.1 polyisoprenoid-binding protein [Nitrospirota bacterium]MDE3226878.1 polyisoprenoid-binding protein [Nitrospirota bacterium]MDE3243418.1 polyisoprenoid-binding protein [Nitrospirota bacterium]
MRRRNVNAALIVAALSLAWGVGSALAEMARYDVDRDHSAIEFRVTHMVVSKTTGRFMEYSGFVEMDPEALTVKTIEATIKTASITTNHEKRDAHLKGPDFFNVEKFPTMSYKLKSYKKVGEGYQAVGELTLLGVTKEITLTGTFNGVAKDPWGNTRAGFSAEGKLNRKDFGMNWSKTLDSGGLVVGDEVFIKLDIECIKAK